MERFDGTTPLRVEGAEVGWVTDAWLERALEPPTPFVLADGVLRLPDPVADFARRSAALAGWAAQARERWSLPGWRDERVVVREDVDGRPLFCIERALLRPLGLPLRSVLACAWTRAPDGPRTWVARRAAHKPVDPGRLDALVAGGIAGFDDPLSTLLRECAEEAGIGPALARAAVPAGTLDLAYPTACDGLPAVHRERILLFDLELPPDVVPTPVDAEHESIVAMGVSEALASIAAGGWTREGAQATTDLLLRIGALPRPADGSPR